MKKQQPKSEIPCAYCHEQTVYVDKFEHQWCASCDAYNGPTLSAAALPSLFEPRWPGDWYGRPALS